MFSQNQSEVKLEWMYKGAQSNVDREEYLLGKSIDKGLEQLNAEEKQQQLGVKHPKNHVEHECIPPSIRDYKEQIGEQVDINAKLQEDPLIAIKKREEEKRKQFLNNPVQIKKLQKALKQQRCMKKNKHKKTKSDSDLELDKKLAKKLRAFKNVQILSSKSNKTSNMLNTILMHKYNQFKHHLSQNDVKAILEGNSSDSTSSSSSSSSSSSTSDDSDSNDSNLRLKNKKKSIRNNDSKKYTDRGREQKKEKPKKKKYSTNKVEHRKSGRDKVKNRKSQGHHSDGDDHYRENKNREKNKYKYNSSNNSKSYNEEYDSYDSESNSKKRNWGLVKGDGTKLSLTKRTSSNKAMVSAQDTSKDKNYDYKKRTSLTEEEKEKRRQEMMVNAAWRNKERAQNLKTYRETKLKEDSQKEYNPEFLTKELLRSANSSSVESRIKANINNIQRSSNDMSRHFSKR
ncbi:hypothetical protein FQA39_LY13105 [Lamprigera yunnana]|nr:hypothetical protein FQA39_LY13105 [Lamprigera yunnana]